MPLSAQDLEDLVPDGVTGPVTREEVDRYDAYYPYFYIPSSNNEKKMTWDLSPFIHSLVYMYEITGEIKYIDRAIKCCNKALSAKRTDDVDYVTQRIIPGWAYYFEQFTDYQGNPVIYNNVVGNGCIIRAISQVARVIRRDNLGESYQQKALSYIQSCTETIHAFIDHPEWFDSTTLLFHFPDNNRHEECLAGVRGLTSAFNRQLVMVTGMLNVVKYYEITGEEAALRSRYTAIVDSVANYFWNSVTTHGSGESTYYLWMYREEGKNGDPPRMEDIGHGSLDIKCIVQIHEDLGIGSAEQLSRIGNTLMEHTQYAAHAFANKIDGSDKYKNPDSQRRASIKWLPLSDWDRRVFHNAGWQLTSGLKLKKAESYAVFLYYKAKYYGTDLTVSDGTWQDSRGIHAPPDAASADDIRICPNPAQARIRVTLPFDAGQVEVVRIIEPVSGSIVRAGSDNVENQGGREILLDVSGLSEGLYLIMIRTGDGLVIKRFVKI